MSAVAKLHPDTDKQQETRDAVAALRFLAAACEHKRESLLNDEESYGFGVILKMIAAKVEGATT